MDDIDRLYRVKQKSLRILKRLEEAKIELRLVKDIAHAKRIFAPPREYMLLQKRVAGLKIEHQESLAEIAYLSNKITIKGDIKTELQYIVNDLDQALSDEKQLITFVKAARQRAFDFKQKIKEQEEPTP